MNVKERMGMIGGSDIAAVMGMSRWTTPLKLWAEKTGEIEREDISDLEHVELGTELEDFVAKKFERRYKKDTGVEIKVRRDSRDFRHKKYPFLVAHIDRRITGSDELLECKTCSAFKLKEWEGDEIPREYILQVIWYLGICEMKKGYIAVLIGGQKFMWKEIEFDKDLFDMMVKAAVRFMDSVEKKEAPMASVGDKDTLSEIFPEGAGVYEPTDKEVADFNVALSSRAELLKQKKDIEDAIEALENRVKQTIGECEALDTGKYKVSWKTQERGEYVVPAKSFRMFRVTQKKEKKS